MIVMKMMKRVSYTPCHHSDCLVKPLRLWETLVTSFHCSWKQQCTTISFCSLCCWIVLPVLCHFFHILSSSASSSASLQVAIIAGNFELAELIKNHKEKDIGE